MRAHKDQYLLRFLADERGATAVEYALVIGLIASAIVGSITSIGVNINNHMNTVASSING